MNENTKRASEENLGVIYDKNEYAGFLKRVIIAAVDLIVLAIFAVISLSVSYYFIYYADNYIQFNLLFILFLAVLYLGFLKRSKYRTLGYILTGVKIVDLKGNRPTIFKMILRVFMLFFGPFELIFDIIWLTSEATKQTLRDKYVGTYVVNRHAIPVGKAKLQNVTLGVMGWNLMYREIKESQIQ